MDIFCALHPPAELSVISTLHLPLAGNYTISCASRRCSISAKIRISSGWASFVPQARTRAECSIVIELYVIIDLKLFPPPTCLNLLNIMNLTILRPVKPLRPQETKFSLDCTEIWRSNFELHLVRVQGESNLSWLRTAAISSANFRTRSQPRSGSGLVAV